MKPFVMIHVIATYYSPLKVVYATVLTNRQGRRQQVPESTCSWSLLIYYNTRSLDFPPFLLIVKCIWFILLYTLWRDIFIINIICNRWLGKIVYHYLFWQAKKTQNLFTHNTKQAYFNLSADMNMSNKYSNDYVDANTLIQISKII